MSKQNTNRQDRWLIQRWDKALQFEAAMQSARSYYEQLFYKVLEAAKKKYAALRSCSPKQLSGRLSDSALAGSGGCAGFTNPVWFTEWAPWPSGIWISNISLDELVTERATAPNASIWLSREKISSKKLQKLRGRLLTRARKLVSCRAIGFQTEDEGDGVNVLWYYLPEERAKLLQMVLQDGGQPFVSCVSQHVELMASLLQGSDDLLR